MRSDREIVGIYEEDSRVEDAINAYRRAVTKTPRYLMALVALGRALATAGKVTEAREHWQKAIDLAKSRLNPSKPSRSFDKIIPGFDKKYPSPGKIIVSSPHL